MVIVGIDAHTQSHTAAAVDEHGRELVTFTVGARPAELDRLMAWIGQLGDVTLVAIEGAKGFGLPITRRLLATDVQVVDIPTHLTALGRRSSRSRGKDDPADAVTIARMALREPDLPRLRASHLVADLKLLVDARDQLVAEGTRIRNRLHALLLALAPGYRAETGALSSSAALRTAARLIRVAAASDPIRARLAISAIRRLKVIDAEAAGLEREIAEMVEASGASRLRAICGVGPIVAAKLLGETHDVDRFPTAAAFAAHAGVSPIPASSGTTTRHRLNRGGNRQLNRARYSRSPWSKPAGTARAAPISLGNVAKARQPVRRVAA